jgi:D-aminopeptidase
MLKNSKRSLVILIFMLSAILLSATLVLATDKPRARDLGIPFDGKPGKFNAITDVKGVEVGHATIISGQGKLVVGKGPARTGVTAILPAGRKTDPLFASWFAFNGNGEMTGTTWVEESGFLESPILITNTFSVGIVRDTLIDWLSRNALSDPTLISPDLYGGLPVVAETYDGRLNDIDGFHVKKEHVLNALDSARSGPVAEGNVGGGTGMMCHEFKGGIGTSSRVVNAGGKDYTVGVLVQANYGSRRTLTIAGVPVGKEITDLMPVIYSAAYDKRDGSIVVVVATDAPLLPHQLKRLAKRVPLGIGRMGGLGDNYSGDIFIAFSTANPGSSGDSGIKNVKMLPNEQIDPFFEAIVQATEEAITNALIAAETMTGINGNTIYAIPHDRLKEILKRYNRLKNPN